MYTVYVQYVWYVYYCIHSSVRPSMHVHFVCIQCIYTVYASRYYTVYVYYVCKLLSYLFLYIHLSVRPLMPLSDRPTDPWSICPYMCFVWILCMCVGVYLRMCTMCRYYISYVYVYYIYVHLSVSPSIRL